jgi:hypothetical protein
MLLGWGCVWLIICIVSAIISATIMKSKGRSVAAGVLLGIFLGAVGLIIVLVLPKDEFGVMNNKLKSGYYKQCHVCKEIIDVNALVCPHCQSQQIPSLNPK